MTQKAKVLEKNSNSMKIEVVRNGSCSQNCTSCKGCSGGQKKIIIDVPDDKDAKTGDIIDIQVDTGKVIALSAVTYIIPIICLLIGYALGAKISENMGIICAFIGLAVPVPLLVWVNRKVKDSFFSNIKTKV